MGRRWSAGPGLGRAGSTGQAQRINVLYNGPQPGPARQIARGWAAARPSPPNVQRMGRGTAQPITFSKIHGPALPGLVHHFQKSRPGLAHHMATRPMKHGLYMGRPDNYVGRPVDLTGRPMCCSVPKRACTHYADVNF